MIQIHFKIYDYFIFKSVHFYIARMLLVESWENLLIGAWREKWIRNSHNSGVVRCVREQIYCVYHAVNEYAAAIFIERWHR